MMMVMMMMRMRNLKRNPAIMGRRPNTTTESVEWFRTANDQRLPDLFRLRRFTYHVLRVLHIDRHLGPIACVNHGRPGLMSVVGAVRVAEVAFAAITSWAFVSRVDWNHIRSMLMGVLGLAAFLELIVLKAADTPTKAHFGVSVASAVLVLSVKENDGVDGTKER